MDPVTFTTETAGVDWRRLKAELVADRFDNGRSAEQLRLCFENSFAVAFAFSEGRGVGKARALSDGVCKADVVDVWTQTGFPRRGVASRLIRDLFAWLPGQHAYLFTDGPVEVCTRLGFEAQGVGLGKTVGRWLRPGPLEGSPL